MPQPLDGRAAATTNPSCRYNTGVIADLLLAIETSSARGSVALGRGARVLGATVLPTERRHTSELLPAIRDLLHAAGHAPRDVGVVAFSQGPGSFTGLRIAATVARMWQSAVGSRVVGVPSLEVCARNALTHPDHPARVAVLVDARRNQVFGGLFERLPACASTESPDGLTALQPAALHDVAAWLATIPRPCALLGDGVARNAEAIAAAGADLLPLPLEYAWPDARQVLAIGARLANEGHFLAPGEIVPAYHRPPECEEVYEQRRAEAKAKRGEA